MDIVVCNGLIGSVMDIVGLQWIQWICNGYTGSVIGVMGLCPGQYHYIFRILIYDIFRRKTTT